MGDAYSIADIATFPWVRIAVGLFGAGAILDIEHFPNVMRALAAFLARPAVIQGVATPAAAPA